MDSASAQSKFSNIVEENRFALDELNLIFHLFSLTLKHISQNSKPVNLFYKNILCYDAKPYQHYTNKV